MSWGSSGCAARHFSRAPGTTGIGDTGEVDFDMSFGEIAEAKVRRSLPARASRGSARRARQRGPRPNAFSRATELIGLDGRRAAYGSAFARRHAVADAVIGADGVHSLVEEQLLGAAPPNFTGRMAYRTTFPSRCSTGIRSTIARSGGAGPAYRHLLRQAGSSELYFVTSQPEPEINIESWSAKGDVKELRDAFEGFDPEVATCWPPARTCTNGRSSIAIRCRAWGEGNVTLLGDACHPMTPYMAQGAAMAMEDAAVLSRCLDGVERDGVANAFRRFEASRKPRTTRVQQTSRTNTWLKDKTDTDWVYAYDAWNAPLAAHDAA